MFQTIKTSWQRGLLSDSIAKSLMGAVVGLASAITVITLARLDSYDGALTLRFATSEGYYDEGAWYRPLLIVLFTIVVAVVSFILSSSLFEQKDRELSRGLLVCAVVVLVITLMISLNFVVPSQV